MRRVCDAVYRERALRKVDAVPGMRAVIALWVALCIGMSVPTAHLHAQEATGSIRGRVLSPEGRGMQEVRVRAVSSTRQLETRTDSDGLFQFVGLAPGRWSVVVQVLGFLRDSTTVDVPARVLIHDVTLQQVATALDRQIVRADWVGVRGVVGTRDHEAIANASITVAGKAYQTRSESSGQFAMELPKNQSWLLRVTAPGYASRYVSARTWDRGGPELAILLDSAGPANSNTMLEEEMQRRLRIASPMAARVSREELLQYGINNLLEAVSTSSGFVSRGMVLNRDACVFVDGVAKPGWPLDAIDPRTVEFIEAYGASDDRSGTLATRWPLNAPCGVSVAGVSRRRGTPGANAKYIVVWTRKP